MITIFSVINALLLLSISLLHFYWMFGGTWGIEVVVPRKTTGESVMSPKRFATFFVVVALLLISALFLIYSGIAKVSFPSDIVTYGVLLAGMIFMLRAIGEFRYVGFTKKVTNSKFAQLDTRFYSPLCLYLGASSLAIYFLS